MVSKVKMARIYFPDGWRITWLADGVKKYKTFDTLTQAKKFRHQLKRGGA